MLAELKFSDARSKFTDVIDNALQNRPTVIKARKTSEDRSIVMSFQMVHDLMNESKSCPKLKVEYMSEPDGSVVATLDPFDLVVSGKTKEEAVENLINDAIDYATEYMNEYSLYRNSKNRRNHFPLVFQILASDSRDQIKEVIGVA